MVLLYVPNLPGGRNAWEVSAHSRAHLYWCVNDYSLLTCVCVWDVHVCLLTHPIHMWLEAALSS